MRLNYDWEKVVGEKKHTRETRIKASKVKHSFGSSKIRFALEDFDPVPGVGSYDTCDPTPLLRRSPSVSSSGYAVSKSMKAPLFVDKGTPGPSQYKVKTYEMLDKDPSKHTVAFKTSGKGRVPFAPPEPNPGPLSYRVSYDVGVSPVLARKSTSAFTSKTKLAGLFDDKSIAPPVGLYNIESDLLVAKNDFQWSKSTHDRFAFIGRDNKVPGPHVYFATNKIREAASQDALSRSRGSGDVGRFSSNSRNPNSRPSTTSSPHSLPQKRGGAGGGGGGSTSRPRTVGIEDIRHELQRFGLKTPSKRPNNLEERYSESRSLRCVGNFRGKQLGKQYERPKFAVHTFGADKDRFKDSVYGRLDLKAEIPGPGEYTLRKDAPVLGSPSADTHTNTISHSHDSASPPKHTFGRDVDRFKNSMYGRLDLKAQIPGPGAYDVAAVSPTNSRGSPYGRLQGSASSEASPYKGRPPSTPNYDPRLSKIRVQPLSPGK